MLLNKSFIAIIPARGGSKRLVGKNLLKLGGVPLIAWTIKAALGCESLDEVIVSTDSDDIKDVALEFGATVPFKRPSNLATDTSSGFEVIEHAVEYYKNKHNRIFDYVLVLQPTSPFRSKDHIDQAIKILLEKDASAVISVCESEHPPQWMGTLPADGDMSNFIADEIRNMRSQDLSKYYRLNGAIYICNTKELINHKTFFLKSKIFSYVMKNEHSVDIDDIDDFNFAEFLLSKK